MTAYRGPQFSDDARDPDRSAVYDAEQAWEDECYGLPSEPERLAPDALDAFLAATLEAAGYDASDLPTVVLDVPDEVGEGDEAGWHEGATGVIHLHPHLLKPTILLHELAHWIDSRDGHGPMFQANMLTLVLHAMGPDAAGALWTAYADQDLEPDRCRMDDVIDALGEREG